MLVRFIIYTKLEGLISEKTEANVNIFENNTKSNLTDLNVKSALKSKRNMNKYNMGDTWLILLHVKSRWVF